MEENEVNIISSDELEQYVQTALAKARELAMDSDEYKNCGFRIGSKVKIRGIEQTAKIDDIVMLMDIETLEPKLGVFVKIGRKKTSRKLDNYKDEIEEVVKF